MVTINEIIKSKFMLQHEWEAAQNITLHVVCLSLCNNRKTKWYRNELFKNHLPPTHSTIDRIP